MLKPLSYHKCLKVKKLLKTCRPFFVTGASDYSVISNARCDQYARFRFTWVTRNYTIYKAQYCPRGQGNMIKVTPLPLSLGILRRSTRGILKLKSNIRRLEIFYLLRHLRISHQCRGPLYSTWSYVGDSLCVGYSNVPCSIPKWASNCPVHRTSW